MDAAMQAAKHVLFEPDQLAVRDVKLFPGSSRDVSAATIAEEITKVLAQIQAGDYEDITDED